VCETSPVTPKAQGPFNRRVRLVVEVRDDQDELDLATDVFTARGGGAYDSNAPLPRLVRLGCGVLLTGSMTFAGRLFAGSLDAVRPRLGLA
jgi:hypothetical protein